jgi:hypothetical protein
MKHVAELDLGLLAIVIGWINCGDPSNACSIPVIFGPLMVCDIEFELLHNTLDGMVGSDLAQAYVGEDSMNYEERCRASFGTSESFLMELELFCVD